MKRMNPISPDEKTKDAGKGRENTTQKKGEEGNKRKKDRYVKEKGDIDLKRSERESVPELSGL